MAKFRNPLRWLPLLFALSLVSIARAVSGEYFKPFNVSYDHRAIIIDGRRRILNSAGVHYPRASPEMWPDLIAKSKEGGADVIQTYVFWNGHEPIRGQFNFEGRFDLVKFVRLVAANGLYLHLRIGPYVCAEWNFGGFPIWLRDLPGIEFRTNNAPFKEEMQRFVKKIVDLMREEGLYSWQGGPIIMLQIENEYGDVEKAYGEQGKEYVKWAANMAVGLDARVPWIMCKQTDAPENILDACNGYYCDGFRPNSKKKPVLWTEDWDGWYASWGGSLPHRPVKDLAFAVARFFQRGGSFQNYYMYFGGTNFGRTSGGPFYITSYDYDAPINEYGVLSQPKWGHLKDLHAAIKLCEPALVAVDSPQYLKLGPMQEAHVYQGQVKSKGLSSIHSKDVSLCSAFLANIDEKKASIVRFRGQLYTLPPWSVSILPDCRNVAFNSAKIGAQTSIEDVAFDASHFMPINPLESVLSSDNTSSGLKNWEMINEPIGVWSGDNLTVQGILEHLNVTKDSSDYLWYCTRVYVSDEEISLMKRNGVNARLTIDSMRDGVHIFVNGHLAGTTFGHWVKVTQTVELLPGYNDVKLFSLTIGMQNYGAFLEKDGGGFKGQIKLTGSNDWMVDLSQLSWTYQVGLKGELEEIYSIEGEKQADWSKLTLDNVHSGLRWYKTYFDASEGQDPVVLDLRSMGKGQVWINGHHIGRYWTRVASKDGYHVPRSWLYETQNLLVLFEEREGNPFEISVKTVSTQTICGQISETNHPPLSKWYNPEPKASKPLINDTTPELQLLCKKGHVISIQFASYGTPRGACQRYSKGHCHSPNSFDLVYQACEGRETCSVAVSNANFGDPCHGVVKKLAVEARCISPTLAGLSSMK
ncbi:hypothetical protein V2J09_008453 [Rumex salicifolius]